MKLIPSLFFIVITLIKHIESCMKLTGCSWKADPCNKYTTMDTCFEHKCTWGGVEAPSVNGHIDIGDGPGVPNTPNNQLYIPEPIVCKGKDYKACYISCSIF